MEKASYCYSVYLFGLPFSLNSSPVNVSYFLARSMIDFKRKFKFKKSSGMFVFFSTLLEMEVLEPFFLFLFTSLGKVLEKF